MLLQIGRDLRIRNYQFRKDGMCSAAFFAFDAKNAKDNGSLPGLKPSSVITVAYQAAGMPTVATELIQWNICRYLSVNFRSYPLEAIENSCYHDNAMMRAMTFAIAGCMSRDRAFLGRGSLLFVMSAGLEKPAVMITCIFMLLKVPDASVYTAAYHAVRGISCS